MRYSFFVTALLGALFTSGTAHALIFEDFERSVSVEFFDADGNAVANDSDSEALPPGGIFTQPLSAFIGGGGFSAQIGMNESGFFGVAGSQFVPGRLETNVFIAVRVTNDQAAPVDVPFNFIINDGSFTMFAGEGSTLSYGLAINTTAFNSVGTLTAGPFGSSFAPSFDDIGAAFDGFSQVDIPFSFQGVTETLDPGEDLLFTYNFAIRSDIQVFSEIVAFEFQDPLLRSDLPADATQFGPGDAVAATVSEPGTLARLAPALLALGGIMRRRAGG